MSMVHFPKSIGGVVEVIVGNAFYKIGNRTELLATHACHANISAESVLQPPEHKRFEE